MAIWPLLRAGPLGKVAGWPSGSCGDRRFDACRWCAPFRSGRAPEFPHASGGAVTAATRVATFTAITTEEPARFFRIVRLA